jgi:23S rRNA (cytidine1920-2'-O)/16S rRNA (cytidine1409-2'-O)-methyltransferase
MARRRADIVLVEKGLFESRAKAQAAIDAGRVSVDGRPVKRAAEPIEEAGYIVAEPAFRWVGRGALKLDHALDLWEVKVAGQTVIDVGASTGGFTEVCLERGARRVYAVDVGRGQLHARLRDDERVVDLSGTDARRLDAGLVPEPPGLIVSDVSFIALEKALPAALALAAPGAELVVLVKPQFEAGREHVGKNGLVKDPQVRALAVERVKAFLTASGWTVRDVSQSPVAGGEGAVEYLLWASLPGP